MQAMAAEQDMKDAKDAPRPVAEAEIKGESPTPTKICKTCKEEKPLNQYHKIKGYHLNTCKKCVNKTNAAKQKAKYVPSPKKRGFANLPEETKRRIIDEVAAGKMIRLIADGNGVSVDQLRAWKNRGKLIM